MQNLHTYALDPYPFIVMLNQLQGYDKHVLTL